MITLRALLHVQMKEESIMKQRFAALAAPREYGANPNVPEPLELYAASMGAATD